MTDNISQDIAISGEGNIVVGKGDVIINPLPPAEARLRHDLGILLKNVQTTWIKGVLEKSVHDAALLELGMELREEAVDNPWRMVMEKPDQLREVLPQGRKIKDIFNEANRLLLILGEPGSGKTTTLLQLARDLIAEVDQSFTQPIPVILNLSTWTNKQQPLDEWLIGELNSKYRLPKRDGKKWLKDRRIMPMLDGLDEVKLENRAACVKKINQLVSDYGLQGLVVCSRIKDYTDLNVRLAFYRAIYIQPLTFEQVDEYFNQAGDKLASLRATLHSDEALRSMAQSPLILNIMSLAYHNTPAEALSNQALKTDEARRKHLFDAYITKMFNRKVSAQAYDDEQTKQRLSWLAQNLQKHNQDVFLIEGLQPSWLSAWYWQWVYVFASRLVSFQAIELVFSGVRIVGLSVGFIDILRFEWLRKQRGMRKTPTFWWSVVNIMIVYISAVLTYGGLFGLREGLSDNLFFSLFLGLFFGLRGSRQSLENDTETVDALRWSWRMAAKSGLMSGVVGVIFTSLFSVSNGGWPSFLDAWTWSFIMGGLAFGLLGVFLGGMRKEVIETKSTPNQGIRLSMKNAIFGGSLSLLSFGLLFWAIYWKMTDGTYEPYVWPIFGMIGVLWYGGLDVIQHYTLRLILIIQGHIPGNYTRFLDYAVDRIFLQKVGGGYRFIHRLLLEHFAEMYEPEKKI